MKNIFKSMWAVAVAAMAFTSCSEDDALDVTPEVEKVTINITAGSEAEAESRTHLDGTAQVKWDAEGEALQVIEYTTKMADATTTSATVSQDGLTAKFTVDLPKNTSASTYDYYAIYPAANFIDGSKSFTNFKIQLPNEQTPTENSFDPKADLLVSNKVTTAEQATSLDFKFHRPITVVQLQVQLTGITEGEKITNVVFKNTKASLAGRMHYNWDSYEIADVYTGFNSISLTCDKVAQASNDFYFTSFPAELTDFTVIVSTDKATYTKEVTGITPGKLSFKAGHKANVRVSGLTRQEKVYDTYTLLTADNILAEGYKLIIANGNTGTVKAMGAPLVSKSAKDMGLSSDIKVVDANGATVVNEIPVDAQVFTLEGDATNGFLLHSADGYLTSTKDKDLHFENLAKDASKWNISATGITCGNIHIRYNSSTNYFRTYTGTSVNPVYAFFKEGKPKTALATPTNLNVTVDANTATVTWSPVENAVSYTVTCGENVQTVNAPATTATIKNLPWDSGNKIEVVANPKEGDEIYKSSAAAIATATVGPNPNMGNGTISELRSILKDAAFVDQNLKTYNGGSVEAYVAAHIGSKLYVVDNTGNAGSGIVLYSATITGTANAGQKVTIDLSAATKNLYNGMLQIKGAEVSVSTAPSVTIKKPVITAAEFNNGNYQAMYVSIKAKTPDNAGTWGSLTSMTDVNGTSFNIDAANTLSAVEYGANKTGLISGIADCNTSKGQHLDPQTAADVEAFKDTTPRIDFTSKNETVESTATTAKFAFTRNSFAETSNVTASTTDNWVTVSVVNNDVVCSFSANSAATSRTATIKVSLNGTEVETLTLTQVAQGAATAKTYKLVIDGNNLSAAAGGSGYAKYNGSHNINVKSVDETSTVTVSFTTSQVMPQNGVLQFQKSKGTMTSTGDWGIIKSVEVTDTNIKVTYTEDEARNKTGFILKTGAKGTSTVTITFEM